MPRFYANVLLATTGGTKKDAAANAADAGKTWRASGDLSELEFDKPDDYNNDVEGFAEWTTSFEFYVDAADEQSARERLEALLKAEEAWNVSGEIVRLRLDTA